MGLDKNKKIAIGLIGISIFLIIGVWSTIGRAIPDPIYLWGIPKNISNVLITIIWPYFGSIIFVLVFPRIFAPLYLKTKKIQFKGYENVFIKNEKPDLSLKRILKRSFSVSLLSIGLAVTLIGFGIINPIWVTTPSVHSLYLAQGTNLNYTLEAVMMIPSLIYPFSVGLLSIGWVIEDCVIMHYKVPDETEGIFFEIEPVHVRYKDVLSGYAGLSSIIFILGALYYYFMQLGDVFFVGTMTTLLLILFSIFILMIPMFFSYLLYYKLDKSYLIKNLPEIRRISKEDLESILRKR